MAEKKHIVVIGGGYAGISLLDKLKNTPNIKLTLIDHSDVHLLQTHIHKYLSGYYAKDEITCSHSKYCSRNKIDFHCKKIVNIDYDAKKILGEDGQSFVYDYLIIATGGQSLFPKQIENIEHYTQDIKNITVLDKYREDFLSLLNSQPIDKKIVIVGGGVSGLQIACEYGEMIQQKGLNSNHIEITLVEGMDSILPGMNTFLIEQSMKRCEELNIRVVTKLFASKISQDKLTLSNKEEISYDMLLFVIGSIGNFISSSQRSDIESNPRNQFVVDEYYRINSQNSVFAIGDIAEAIDTKTKTPQTPTAQSARMQAELTAKNIMLSIAEKPLIKNNISNKGILIDLGGKTAIGRLFGINVKGKVALWLKKLIYALHSKKLD